MTTVITQGEIYESLITSLAESCNCVAKHRPIPSAVLPDPRPRPIPIQLLEVQINPHKISNPICHLQVCTCTSWNHHRACLFIAHSYVTKRCSSWRYQWAQRSCRSNTDRVYELMRQPTLRPALTLPKVYLYRDPIDFRKSHRGLSVTDHAKLIH